MPMALGLQNTISTWNEFQVAAFGDRPVDGLSSDLEQVSGKHEAVPGRQPIQSPAGPRPSWLASYTRDA
jgi:hypothetical protein